VREGENTKYIYIYIEKEREKKEKKKKKERLDDTPTRCFLFSPRFDQAKFV
jgi:hypothetical protein